MKAGEIEWSLAGSYLLVVGQCKTKGFKSNWTELLCGSNAFCCLEALLRSSLGQYAERQTFLILYLLSQPVAQQLTRILVQAISPQLGLFTLR